MLRIKFEQFGREIETYISTDAISSIEVSKSSDGEVIVAVRMTNGMSYGARGENAEEVLSWLRRVRREV